jgi:iron complex outermembrane receptor protein
MLNFKKYVLLLLVFISLAAKAQQNCNLTIKGRIIDDDTNLPVSGVSIILHPNNQTVISDGHGYFTIPNLCKGDYTLTVSSLGFETKEKAISLSSNQNLSLKISHTDFVLHDVHVIGHQQRLKTTASVSTITREELAQSKGESLAEILKTTPGVTMLQTGATISKPVIHGMHSNRVLLVNNGIKQEDQQWGSEHAPEIDPFVASTIHIIKGAESVRYGAEAIGGVIRVEPAPLPIDGGISGEIDLVGATNGRSTIGSARLEGIVNEVPGLAWRAQGTYKRSGNFKTADYYLNNTGLKEINYSAALTYRNKFAVIDAYYSHFNTDIGIFSGSHIGSLEDLKMRIENGRPFEDGEFGYTIQAPKQKVAHDLVKVKAHKDLDNGAQLDLQYGFQRNARKEYDIRRGERSDIPALDLLLNAHSLDFSFAKTNSKGFNTTIGVNANAIVNNNIPGTYSTPLIPNYDSFGLGIFAIERLIKENYELEAGIRYDYKSLDAAGYNKDKELYGGKHAYNNVSGSLGALWRLSRSVDLRSNIGLAWRPPTVNELYSNSLHHGAASIEIGDANLNSEQGYKWINTFSIQKESFQIELNAYGHFLKNYIYLNPTGTFDESLRGTFPVFEYKQTDALFYGLDLAAAYAINENFQYQLKGSLVRARDEKNEKYLPFIPSDRINNALRITPNFGHSALGKTYFQVQYETVFKQTRYNEASDFTVPPNTYSLLSLNAGTSFKINNQELGISLSGENILNKLYKEYMNRFRYYAHDRGRNLTLRLSYKF